MKKKRWLFRLFRRRVIAALMILLQIAVLALAITKWSRAPWFALGMWVFSAVVIVYIVLKRDKRVAILPWIVLCLAFPVFGGLFYFTFHLGASPRFIRRGVKGLTGHIAPPPAAAGTLEAAEREYPEHARLMRYLCSAEGFSVYDKTEVTYLCSGEEKLRALTEALSLARHYIFLEYFIIEDGIMWEQVHAILKEKAAAGVKVRMIYDDVGCFLRLPADFSKQMEREGIECAVFNPFRPVLTSLHNHRDHRKIVVIDGVLAFTGGANLADEYINAVQRFGHWKDAAVRLRGEAARAFAAIFMENWCLCRGKAEDAAPYLSCDPTNMPDVPTSGYVQPYADTPLDDRAVGEEIYLSVISAARETLYITTPYFIVEDAMVRALVNAAKSGVDVRIVTPHIGDKRLVHMATRSYYRDLTAGGVRVYEYTKGFIHSKTVVSDGNISVVGTTNFDYRSLFYHFECGTVIYGEKTAEALRLDFENVLAVSREIGAKECKRGPIRRLLGDLLRIFSPLM